MANLAQLIYAIQDDANREVRDSEDLKFIGHCLANASDTYSQNYQDVFALYATDYMKNGYFVDFGATDGKTINNTYLLEKRYGWKGIVAEPNSYWHNDLIKNRFGHISFDCVYSETGKEVEFIASDTPDISGIKEFASRDEHTQKRNIGKTIKVPTISLLDLLNKYRARDTIDYLSIDTEGSEYMILKAFFEDPEYYNIRNITVEHNYIPEDRELIFQLLSANGYTRKFPQLSRCDDFYTKVK